MSEQKFSVVLQVMRRFALTFTYGLLALLGRLPCHSDSYGKPRVANRWTVSGEVASHGVSDTR